MQTGRISRALAARVGFGCYRLEEWSAQHRSTLSGAISSGVRLLDTAPNYSDGGSERLIGEVLRESPVPREQLCVITKVGLMQGSLLADAQQRERAGSPWRGVVKLSPTAWYCLSPDFIHHSVERSAERLGTWPDVVLLHNPEFILSAALGRGIDGLMPAVRDTFYAEQLRDAFTALEALQLDCYGLSSNVEGCHWSVSGRPNDLEAVSMTRVLNAASAAGRGDAHGCRVLQLPSNLLEPAPTAEASALGFTVLTHRPIYTIPPEGTYQAGVNTPAHLALRSTPPMRPIISLLLTRAREVLRAHNGAAQLLGWEELRGIGLEELALRFSLSSPGVDSVLCGMRKPAYVQQAVRLAAQPPLPPPLHAALAEAMSALLKEIDAEEGRRARPIARDPSPLERRRRRISPIADSHRPATVPVPGQTHASGSASARGYASGSAPAHVDLPAQQGGGASDALQPSADGGPLAAVGMGDRGSGLVYRPGRLAAQSDAATRQRAARGKREGKWVVKVQPPLDQSDDARGGIGRNEHGVPTECSPRALAPYAPKPSCGQAWSLRRYSYTTSGASTSTLSARRTKHTGSCSAQRYADEGRWHTCMRRTYPIVMGAMSYELWSIHSTPPPKALTGRTKAIGWARRTSCPAAQREGAHVSRVLQYTSQRESVSITHVPVGHVPVSSGIQNTDTHRDQAAPVHNINKITHVDRSYSPLTW